MMAAKSDQDLAFDAQPPASGTARGRRHRYYSMKNEGLAIDDG
jgi:hypothetical protein